MRRAEGEDGSRNSDAGRHTTAVLLVHGVGNQKPGSLLTDMAQPCIDALTSTAVAQGFEVKQHAGIPSSSAPRYTTVELAGARASHTVLFAEAVWSDCFRRPPWWQCLLWILRNLPAAVVLLSPDRRDAAVVNAQPHRDGAPLAMALRELARALRPDRLLDDDLMFFVRLFSRILIAGLLVRVALAGGDGNPLVGGLLILGIVAYLASRHNVVGHVVVAATGSAELRKIHDRVEECLTWAHETAKTVIVVAHSQGGYVAHDVLSNADASRQRVVDLVGVGSGLKPIWLLRQMHRPRVLAASWIALLSVAAGEWFLLGFLGSMMGLGHSVRSLFEVAQLFLAPLGAIQAATADAPRVLKDVVASATELGLDTRLGSAQAVALAAWLAGSLLSVRMFGGAYSDQTPARPVGAGCRTWVEFSSLQDPVGRMLMPVLPKPACERTIAVGGHPIADHMAYFSSASILPWHIANLVAQRLGEPGQPAVRAMDDALQARAARRRRLRGGIFAVAVALIALPHVQTARSLLDGLGNAGIYLLSLSFFSGAIFAARERRSHRLALRALIGGAPDDLSAEHFRMPVAREQRQLPATLLLALTVLAFCVMVALVGTGVGGESAPGPMFMLTTLTLAYLLAIGSGYRPGRWWFIVGVAFSGYCFFSVVQPVPHDATVPVVSALPGVMAWLAVAVLSVWVAYLLRPGRLNAGDAG